MGDHKREYCKSGRHKMEGRNVITRKDGWRCCRACQYERNIKFNRAKRWPRMRWGKFSIKELEHILGALLDSGTPGIPLYWELQQYLDSLRGPDLKPVQSTPNHQTLNKGIIYLTPSR